MIGYKISHKKLNKRISQENLLCAGTVVRTSDEYTTKTIICLPGGQHIEIIVGPDYKEQPTAQTIFYQKAGTDL